MTRLLTPGCNHPQLPPDIQSSIVIASTYSSIIGAGGQARQYGRAAAAPAATQGAAQGPGSPQGMDSILQYALEYAAGNAANSQARLNSLPDNSVNMQAQLLAKSVCLQQ